MCVGAGVLPGDRRKADGEGIVIVAMGLNKGAKLQMNQVVVVNQYAVRKKER